MIRTKTTYKLYIALLLCFLQVAGIGVFAQVPSHSHLPDTIQTAPLLMELAAIPVDSLVVDSIAAVNQENLAQLDSITNPELTLLSADSIVPAAAVLPPKVWIPNPTKSTWFAVVFPGGGQIYNRKYWKLPIIYGGFVGCAYALTWNNNMFRDYSQAYVDIMDKNPATNSYFDFLPPGTVVDERTDTRWGPLFQRRKDYYRRYRDISVFAFIAVYLLSIVDAYVDAELSDFDISPDISMRVQPSVINNQQLNYIGNKGNAVGLQCSFIF